MNRHAGDPRGVAAVPMAAKTWNYCPAMKESQAVKYMKRAAISPAAVARKEE
jgi:hypothetical protein